ncbi:hypothetical protein, partial [Acidithiobacillus thiooxidans]
MKTPEATKHEEEIKYEDLTPEEQAEWDRAEAEFAKEHDENSALGEWADPRTLDAREFTDEDMMRKPEGRVMTLEEEREEYDFEALAVEKADREETSSADWFETPARDHLAASIAVIAALSGCAPAQLTEFIPAGLTPIQQQTVPSQVTPGEVVTVTPVDHVSVGLFAQRQPGVDVIVKTQTAPPQMLSIVQPTTNGSPAFTAGERVGVVYSNDGGQMHVIPLPPRTPVPDQLPGAGTVCYVFRYLSRGLAIYPMVIQKDLENG